MAQSTASKFITILLFLSFFLAIVSMAESRKMGIKQFQSRKAHINSVSCSGIYAQESGDTCTSVAQEFGLSLDYFLAVNPNINCDSVFVGEWLCVDGSVSP